MTDEPKTEPATDRDWYAWLIEPLPDGGVRTRLLRATARFTSGASRIPLLCRAPFGGRPGRRARAPIRPAIATSSLVRRRRQTSPSGEYTNDAGRVHPLEVARLFDDGATVIFNQLHKRVPALARLCVALGRRFSSRVQTNVYLTPPERAGVCAALGHPRRLRAADQRHEALVDLRHQGEDCRFGASASCAGTPPGDVSDEFELGPGSAVYLPRGLMHSARSTGQASLHVTLGLTAFTWAEFLAESVTAAALEEESLRRNLPSRLRPRGVPRRRARAPVRREAGVRAVKFRCGARVAALCRRGPGHRRAAVHRPVAPAAPHGSADARSRVRRRAGLLTEAATEGETCRLRFCGRELRLPAGAWPALRFATTADEFAVEDLPDCLDADGKLTLVTRLVREGVLQRS